MLYGCIPMLTGFSMDAPGPDCLSIWQRHQLFPLGELSEKVRTER